MKSALDSRAAAPSLSFIFLSLSLKAPMLPIILGKYYCSLVYRIAHNEAGITHNQCFRSLSSVAAALRFSGLLYRDSNTTCSIYSLYFTVIFDFFQWFAYSTDP